MKQLLTLSLLFCLFLQVGCTNREPSTEAAREPAKAAMTDSQLKSHIEDKINSDADLKAANLSVSADADQNMATLSGIVENEPLRNKAIEMARAAHPGLNIVNRIEVKPRELTRAEYTPEMAREEVERAKAHKETVGGTLDDAWIHAKIVAKLIGDTETPERKINVDVHNSVVTLRGTVDSLEQKQEAERVAKETDGVKRVSNMLKVVKS